MRDHDEHRDSGAQRCLTLQQQRPPLDSLTRRILQQMEEIRERQDQAALDRSMIRADVDAVHEQVERVGESVDEDQAPDAAPAALAETEMPPVEALPNVDEEEWKLVRALGRKGYRTVGGVTDDSGVPREQVKKALPALALKGVATATTSPRTGGIRWMLTPTGRALLRTAAG